MPSIIEILSNLESAILHFINLAPYGNSFNLPSFRMAMYSMQTIILLTVKIGKF